MLTDNLKAYYSFDSDCITDDHSTYDGTNNGATNTAGGKLSNACDFESTESDYVDIDVVTGSWISESNGGTMCVWYKQESYASWSPISYFSNGGPLGQDLLGGIGTNDGNRFISRVYDNPNTNIVTSGSDISADTNFHFSCFTWNSNGHVTTHYYDGTDLGSDTTNNQGLTDVDSWWIGTLNWRGSPSGYFDGLVDELGIWTRQLNDSEMDDLYNSGNGFAYPFSAGSLTLNTALINHTNSSSNPFSFTVNGTVVDTNDVWNVSFYVNGSLYDEVIGISLNNTNLQFNYTDGNGFYEFNVTAINNESIIDTFVRYSIFIDTINPKINFNSIINESIYNKNTQNLNFNVLHNDTHLEAHNFTIFKLDSNRNRVSVINNTFLDGIIETLYQFNFTDDFSNPNWIKNTEYEVRAESWDGHTDNILRGEPTIVVNTLHYEGIKFYCDKTLKMDYSIKGDSIRPNITFTTPSKKQTCYYETDGEWKKVKKQDDKLYLWYVDIKNRIWIDEKYENVEGDLMTPTKLKIVYTFDKNTNQYISESFGDINYNNKSVFFTLEEYTSYFANAINLSTSEISGSSNQLISNVSINLTQNRDLFIKFVTNSQKLGSAGTNTLSFKLDIDGVTLLDKDLRTMSTVGEYGVSGFITNLSLSQGSHNFELYARETGPGNVEISNIDYTILNFRTQNNETVCSPVYSQKINTISSTTYQNIFNITYSPGYSSKIMMQTQIQVNASAEDIVDIYYEGFSYNSSIVKRYIADSSVLGSIFNPFIENNERSNHVIKVWAKSNNGNFITINTTSLEFCLETNQNSEINNKIIENTTTGFTGNITYNSGIHQITSDNFTLQNSSSIFVETSLTFKSLTGLQTPRINTSFGSCKNTKLRTLVDNNDIGNAFLICKLNGQSVGDTVNFNLTVEVESGEQLLLYDEIINIFEVQDQDLTTINIPSVIQFTQNLTSISDAANAVFNVTATDFNDATVNLTAYWYVENVLVDTQSVIVNSGDQHQFSLSSAQYTAEEQVFANITSYDNTQFGNTLTTDTITVTAAVTLDTLLLQDINQSANTQVTIQTDILEAIEMLWKVFLIFALLSYGYWLLITGNHMLGIPFIIAGGASFMLISLHGQENSDALLETLFLTMTFATIVISLFLKSKKQKQNQLGI